MNEALSPGLFGGKCDAYRQGIKCPETRTHQLCQCSLDVDHDGPHSCWRCRERWDESL
jgi:hypothetical protein